GINTEFYVGNEENLKGQLAYAVNTEIPIIVIIGAIETAKSVALIKDMKARTQEEVKQKKLAERIKEILKK
ncbi:MAG: His/Gly/Thr/Pro-type tRNA ligase C-terminal domain-containing protein, partial [Patescibacteria group bacterium]